MLGNSTLPLVHFPSGKIQFERLWFWNAASKKNVYFRLFSGAKEPWSRGTPGRPKMSSWRTRVTNYQGNFWRKPRVISIRDKPTNPRLSSLMELHFFLCLWLPRPCCSVGPYPKMSRTGPWPSVNQESIPRSNWWAPSFVTKSNDLVLLLDLFLAFDPVVCTCLKCTLP